MSRAVRVVVPRKKVGRGERKISIWNAEGKKPAFGGGVKIGSVQKGPGGRRT